MVTKNMRSMFEAFVQSEAFPCVGAKSALSFGTIDFYEGGRIDRPADDLPLYKAICAFIDTLDLETPVVQSFVAIFQQPSDMDEKAFEEALWNRLQSLHNIDAATGHEWSRSAVADPGSPHFSMSLGGRSFFVIGLHPNASRLARRFEYPALVFNSHEQFEKLRSEGRFETMKKIIRKRDIALEGDINPMLADYGENSEARQYSGREVRGNWRCPFKAQEPLRHND